MPAAPMPDGSAGADRPLVLEEAHAVAGRLRLRTRATLDAEEMTALADRLALLDGVERVVARPNTGSVILSFAGAPEAMRARIAAEPGLKLAAPPKPPPVRQAVQLGLMKLDADIQNRTDQGLDLRTGIAVLLLAGAAAQLVRGRVAGPATTLAVAALSLLDMPKGK